MSYCLGSETTTTHQLPQRVVQVGPTKLLFNEIIDRHAEAYLAAFPEIGEFSNFDKTGTINYYIGMVWTNDFERPDGSQLRIRGSQAIAKNRILDLDLSQIRTQQAFFPGQVVAFKADPHLKAQLTVREFLNPMRIAPPMKKLDMEDGVKLLVARGPFLKQTEQSQDLWTLFAKLIETIRDQEATHVILIGPFVELENISIKERYDSCWQKIFEKLYEGLYERECKIYLVPSNGDILPHYMRTSYFYPRPPMDFKPKLKDGVELKCTVTSVGDPAQIDIGGLYVDVTSAEVLFHLNQCSTFINQKPGDRFVPFYKHILAQGIYPIYPAPQDMAIDYPKLERYLQLDRLGPHILILPTKFLTKLDNVESRLVCAIHKCTIKKHVVLIEIPKIVPNQEDMISLCKHTIIDLMPKIETADEPSQPQSSISNLDSEMALESSAEPSTAAAAGAASEPKEPAGGQVEGGDLSF